jgi:hypothetical protein
MAPLSCPSPLPRDSGLQGRPCASIGMSKSRTPSLVVRAGGTRIVIVRVKRRLAAIAEASLLGDGHATTTPACESSDRSGFTEGSDVRSASPPRSA